MPTSSPVPILSHNSSRASSSTHRSALTEAPRTAVSLGLRRAGDDDDDPFNHSGHSQASPGDVDHSPGASSPSAASPPSPSPASRLSLTLNALTLTSPPQTSASSLSSLLTQQGTPSSSPPADAASLHPTLVSDQLLSLYETTLHKLFLLRSTERLLSSQSGQLLKALQAEESLLTTLNATLKRIRHEHKKLLGRITAPRWEVRHHYHMTCMEHSLGHRQPHVMDVAEMLPGHLRLYAIARCHALVKRGITGGVMRAKGERNSAADQIKEGYRQLRETRSEMKELGRLLEAMNQKTHLLSSDEEKRSLDSIIRKHKRQLASISSNASAKQAMKGGGAPGARHRTSGSEGSNGGLGAVGGLGASLLRGEVQLASPTNASSIRMRYLKSLNMAPRPYDAARGEGVDAGVKEEKKRVVESYNNDWVKMVRAVHTPHAPPSASPPCLCPTSSPALLCVLPLQMHLFRSLEEQRRRKEEEEVKEDGVAQPVTPSPINATPLSSVETLAVNEEELSGSPADSTPVADPTSELRIVQSYRKRMGLVTLPSPLSFSEDDAPLRDTLDPFESNALQEKDEAQDDVNGLLALGREMQDPGSPVAVPFSPSPGQPMSPQPQSPQPSSPSPGSPGSPSGGGEETQRVDVGRQGQEGGQVRRSHIAD